MQLKLSFKVDALTLLAHLNVSRLIPRSPGKGRTSRKKVILMSPIFARPGTFSTRSKMFVLMWMNVFSRGENFKRNQLRFRKSSLIDVLLEIHVEKELAGMSRPVTPATATMDTNLTGIRVSMLTSVIRLIDVLMGTA